MGNLHLLSLMCLLLVLNNRDVLSQPRGRLRGPRIPSLATTIRQRAETNLALDAAIFEQQAAGATHDQASPGTNHQHHHSNDPAGGVPPVHSPAIDGPVISETNHQHHHSIEQAGGAPPVHTPATDGPVSSETNHQHHHSIEQAGGAPAVHAPATAGPASSETNHQHHHAVDPAGAAPPFLVNLPDPVISDIHGNVPPGHEGVHIDLPWEHGNQENFAVVHFGSEPIGFSPTNPPDGGAVISQDAGADLNNIGPGVLLPSDGVFHGSNVHHAPDTVQPGAVQPVDLSVDGSAFPSQVASVHMDIASVRATPANGAPVVHVETGVPNPPDHGNVVHSFHIDLPGQHDVPLDGMPVVHREVHTPAGAGNPHSGMPAVHVETGGPPHHAHGTNPPDHSIVHSFHIDLPGQHGVPEDGMPVVHREVVDPAAAVIPGGPTVPVRDLSDTGAAGGFITPNSAAPISGPSVSGGFISTSDATGGFGSIDSAGTPGGGFGGTASGGFITNTDVNSGFGGTEPGGFITNSDVTGGFGDPAPGGFVTNTDISSGFGGTGPGGFIANTDTNRGFGGMSPVGAPATAPGGFITNNDGAGFEPNSGDQFGSRFVGGLESNTLDGRGNTQVNDLQTTPPVSGVPDLILTEASSSQSTAGMFNRRQPNTGMFNPQQPNPGMFNPQQTNPGMFNPQQTNPGMFNPQQPNPGMFNPQQTNPGMFNPQQPNPGMFNPQQPNPGMFNPQQPNPGMFNPQQPSTGMFNPRQPNPGMFNPQQPINGMFNPQQPNTGMFNPLQPSNPMFNPQPEFESNLNGNFIDPTTQPRAAGGLGLTTDTRRPNMNLPPPLFARDTMTRPSIPTAGFRPMVSDAPFAGIMTRGQDTNRAIPSGLSRLPPAFPVPLSGSLLGDIQNTNRGVIRGSMAPIQRPGFPATRFGSMASSNPGMLPSMQRPGLLPRGGLASQSTRGTFERRFPAASLRPVSTAGRQSLGSMPSLTFARGLTRDFITSSVQARLGSLARSMRT